jgi:signal transduction histidine kinase
MRLRSPASQILAATIALLSIAAIAGWTVMAFASRAFFDELTQELHADIAMYVAQEGLMRGDGQVDIDRLADLARHAMVVNPLAEIYLLDTEGRVVGHRSPTPLAHDRIALETIEQYLQADRPRPIYGLDPRKAQSRRVFSAAEIHSAGRTVGYAYVLLAGSGSDGIATTVAGSHILRAAGVTFLLLVALAAVAAWAIGASISRPLHQLHHRVLQLSSATPADAQRSKGDGAIGLADVQSAVENLALRLNTQLQSLEGIDRSRRTLFASISHDLRTPLTAMRGAIEALTSSNRPPGHDGQHKLLAIALRHCDRLNRLVEQVFALARLDSASVQMRPEPVALAELAQDVATKFQGLAESAGVSLQLEIDPRAPTVVADIGMIETVLQNLLENSLRHTPPGGRIRIVVNTSTRGVETQVVDSGRGIDEDEIARLLQPFETGEGGRSGLGLAIVQRVLQLHGTKLQIARAPGGGTRAAFILMRVSGAESSGAAAAPALELAATPTAR